MAASVQQRDVPESIRALSTLDRLDYGDVFTLTTARATRGTPEDWARATVEDVPLAARTLVWQVMLGLRLERGRSPDHVAGWKIGGRGHDWIRIAARSWMVTAEAVFHLDDQHVSFALFIRHLHPVAALVVPPVTRIHRRAAPGLLRSAEHRLDRPGRGPSGSPT